jgi:hypothetical protein
MTGRHRGVSIAGVPMAGVRVPDVSIAGGQTAGVLPSSAAPSRASPIISPPFTVVALARASRVWSVRKVRARHTCARLACAYLDAPGCDAHSEPRRQMSGCSRVWDCSRCLVADRTSSRPHLANVGPLASELGSARERGSAFVCPGERTSAGFGRQRWLGCCPWTSHGLARRSAPPDLAKHANRRNYLSKWIAGDRRTRFRHPGRAQRTLLTWSLRGCPRSEPQSHRPPRSELRQKLGRHSPASPVRGVPAPRFARFNRCRTVT